MKILHLLLILLLVSEYNQRCNDVISPSSASECNRLSGSDNYRCCFENIEVANGKDKTFCVGIDQRTYDNIKIYAEGRKKIYEGEYNLEDYEIDCSSKYFYISTIYLLITLLFLS